MPARSIAQTYRSLCSLAPAVKADSRTVILDEGQEATPLDGDKVRLRLRLRGWRVWRAHRPACVFFTLLLSTPDSFAAIFFRDMIKFTCSLCEQI
jgi:hypothetical protein